MGGDRNWRHRAGVSDLFSHERSQRLLERQFDLAPDRPLRVLDVGCGDGRRTADLLLRAGAEVESGVWVDPSDEAIRRAQVVVAGAFPRARHEFLPRRIQETDVPPRSFDFVVALNSLYHPRRELGTTIQRLLMCLAPSGLAIFEVSDTLSPLHRLQLIAGRLLTGELGLDVGRSSDIEERLAAAGASYDRASVAESLTLSFPRGRAYSEASPSERTTATWLCGGVAPPDAIGERLFRESEQRATGDSELIIESSVSVFVVRGPGTAI